MTFLGKKSRTFFQVLWDVAFYEKVFNYCCLKVFIWYKSDWYAVDVLILISEFFDIQMYIGGLNRRIFSHS